MNCLGCIIKIDDEDEDDEKQSYHILTIQDTVWHIFIWSLFQKDQGSIHASPLIFCGIS